MAEVQNKEEIVILRLDPVDIFITFQINEEQDVRVENALLTDVPGLTKESIQGVIGHCQKVAETEDIRILNILRFDATRAPLGLNMLIETIKCCDQPGAFS